MQVIMLKSKLHMATVTSAEADYEGSLGIDQELMDAVKILPYEKLLVSNRSNTHRFETYAIPAPRNSRTICLNGPAARLGAAGDRLVIMCFAHVPAEEARRHRPLILVLDEQNRPTGPLKQV
ncbi:MAG: aspartate 1-decarboxylase [Kiritimatiellia bacterium]|nr:aspartate 1-decarboxylase [Lentisphaerota bacterium]